MKNKLIILIPNILDKIDPTHIIDINVTCGSTKRIYLICNICNSNYNCSISNLVVSYTKYNSYACPYCSGKKVNNTNSLISVYPEIAKYLVDKSIGDKVTIKSNKTVDFNCKNCGNIYKNKIYDRVKSYHNNHTGCPYCRNKKCYNNNNLELTHPFILKWWDYDYNTIKPNDIVYGSRKNIHWKCDNGHIWQSKISNMIQQNRCPYCCNRRVCNDNSLQSKYPEIASTWDFSKNYKTPNDFVFGSHFRAHWVCEKGHLWVTSIKNRTIGNTGCPACTLKQSKVETKWLDSLNIIIRQHKIIIGKNYYYVDGFDPNTNTVYEFYGDFYHGNLDKFNALKINKKTGVTFGELYDKTMRRENIIKSAGYNIISIWESDFKSSKNTK